MLRQLLDSLVRPTRPRPDEPATRVNFPLEDLHELKGRHERAPLDTHAQILFGEATIAGQNLLELYDTCMRETGTVVSAWKKLARIQGAQNLARYFVHTLELDGARAECGVFQGFSALMACRAAVASIGQFDGTGLYLIDSFAGFPEPRAEDYIPIRSGTEARNAPAFKEGDAAVSLEQVRAAFHDFPGIRFEPGFIPAVLARLPETSWAFVHIDVDLHEPTLACLEYFYPRLTRGGVIICDDYGSKLFPGARKAWEGYCDANDVAFVALETGQSVLFK